MDYVQNTLTAILHGPMCCFPLYQSTRNAMAKIGQNKIDNAKINQWHCNRKHRVWMQQKKRKQNCRSNPRYIVTPINKRSLLRHNRCYIVAHGCVWFFERASYFLITARMIGSLARLKASNSSRHHFERLCVSALWNVQMHDKGMNKVSLKNPSFTDPSRKRR